MIKHLNGISKEEIMATFPPEEYLVPLRRILSLNEKIEIFKNLSIEKRIELLKREYYLELSPSDAVKFSEAMTDKHKMQEFYNSLSLSKKRGLRHVCTTQFLKRMQIKL